MNNASSERRGIRRSLAAIAVEIVVGFVGVYAAFALQAYHERRDLNERRHQIRLALIEEIKDVKRGTGAFAAGIGRWVATYDSTTRAGGSPPFEPFLTSERFDTHMWNATQQAGGLLLMDVHTYSCLSGYYNELARGFDEIDRLRARSESVLLPNLGKPTDEFYSAPGKVRMKYVWYPLGMQRLRRIAADVNARSDSLIGLLEQPEAQHDPKSCAPGAKSVPKTALNR